MKWHSLGSQDWVRAVGVGIGVSILTAAIMVAALKSGVSPHRSHLSQRRGRGGD